MAKKKFDIYEMNIDLNDLYLMKDFIDMYEDLKVNFNDYNKLVDEIRKDSKVKSQLDKTDDIEKALNQILNKIVKRIAESNNKEELEQLKVDYEKYDKKLKELKKYDSVMNIYNKTYSNNLSKYFENNDSKIEENTRKKYNDYTEEELEEQIRIEKSKFEKKKTNTIEQVYRNIKYLYKVSCKINETEQNKVQVHGLISMVKMRLQKLRLKKSIREINQEFINDEMNLAQVKADKTMYIDMDLLEQQREYFEMFKGPIRKYVDNSIDAVDEARKEAEELPEEIQISENVTVLTRKDQINELKKAKEELTQPEEIIIPTKTA